MLRVPIHQAKPGMILAVDVLHPGRGFRLLKTGFTLEDLVIHKLRDLDVHEIWIEYPHTEQIETYISPLVMRLQGKVVSMIADVFSSMHDEAYADLEYPRYKRTLRDMIESLVSEPQSAAYIVETSGRGSNALRHASEVCFLSLLLGLKLQGYLIKQRRRMRPSDARNVVSLGLGAMLHDIGKTQLSDDVVERYETTRDESDLQWQEHVQRGHKLVTGNIAPAASGIVLHHHQHFDGSGFPTLESVQEDPEEGPRTLSGEDIHVFARIVCVANHFDRLHFQGDGSIWPRVRVLHEMLLGSLTARFDPVVLAALPMVVPAYTPGDRVLLSNGETAVILRWHPEAPCQPLVQVFEENEPTPQNANQKKRPTCYDLRERRDLLIVQQDGCDVSPFNFRLLTLDTNAA